MIVWPCTAGLLCIIALACQHGGRRIYLAQALQRASRTCCGTNLAGSVANTRTPKTTIQPPWGHYGIPFSLMAHRNAPLWLTACLPGSPSAASQPASSGYIQHVLMNRIDSAHETKAWSQPHRNLLRESSPRSL